MCAEISPGVIGRGSEYDGLARPCVLRAFAPETADWAAVDELIEIELTHAPVRIRFRPGQQTSFVYSAALVIELVLDIIENPGNASVWATTTSPCAASTSTSGTVVTVSIRLFEEPASTVQCELEFSADQSGVFEYELVVDNPVVIVIEPQP